MKAAIAFLIAGVIGLAAVGEPRDAGRIVQDVIYREADGVELTLDLYYPQTGSAPYPVVIYVHGGGWTSGNKRGGAGMLDVPTLLDHGYLVAAIDYRLAPAYKFPAQFEDVSCAVRYLRTHADEIGLDPDRIGAYGGSAGGHLVALLGTADEDAFRGDCPWEVSARVQAVVDMFGPADFSLFEFLGSEKAEGVFGASDATDPVFAEASPVAWVSTDDSPFLILHGDRDPVVPLEQSQSLYDHLKAASVPVELVVVKNAGHGFRPTGGRIDPSRLEISEMIASFFDRFLK